MLRIAENCRSSFRPTQTQQPKDVQVWLISDKQHNWVDDAGTQEGASAPEWESAG